MVAGGRGGGGENEMGGRDVSGCVLRRFVVNDHRACRLVRHPLARIVVLATQFKL